MEQSTTHLICLSWKLRVQRSSTSYWLVQVPNPLRRMSMSEVTRDSPTALLPNRNASSSQAGFMAETRCRILQNTNTLGSKSLLDSIDKPSTKLSRLRSSQLENKESTTLSEALFFFLGACFFFLLTSSLPETECDSVVSAFSIRSRVCSSSWDQSTTSSSHWNYQVAGSFGYTDLGSSSSTLPSLTDSVVQSLWLDMWLLLTSHTYCRVYTFERAWLSQLWTGVSSCSSSVLMRSPYFLFVLVDLACLLVLFLDVNSQSKSSNSVLVFYSSNNYTILQESCWNATICFWVVYVIFRSIQCPTFGIDVSGGYRSSRLLLLQKSTNSLAIIKLLDSSNIVRLKLRSRFDFWYCQTRALSTFEQIHQAKELKEKELNHSGLSPWQLEWALNILRRTLLNIQIHDLQKCWTSVRKMLRCHQERTRTRRWLIS